MERFLAHGALRRIYYRDLFGKDLSDLAEEDKIIYIELTELLRNVRQFNSMIKRREDYNFVNMGIACILKERRDLMRQKLKETINRMKQLRRLNRENTQYLDIAGFLDERRKFFQYSQYAVQKSAAE